jgi:hypothetical protein
MDKAFWIELAQNDFKIPPSHTLAELTDELLSYLGSTDGVLRDDIGYNFLAVWIVDHPAYNPTELRQIRDKLLPNLRQHITSEETDLVFLRSFTVLTLGLLVYRDNQQPYLTVEEVRTLMKETLGYFTAEKDWRGYVEGKGWAHAVAHTADMLKFLIRNRHTNMDDHQRILNVLAAKITTFPAQQLTHDEDERLAVMVLELLKRDTVEADFLVAWAERLASWKAANKRPAFDPQLFSTQQNIKQLLRSLYFQLTKNPPPSEKVATFTAAIEKAVRAYNF